MAKAAILGFGTVGSGVAEVLTMNAENISKTVGEGVELKYIVDVRDFPDSPFAPLMTKDFSDVENDPEIDVVAEVIGGATVAYDFTKRALMAGKSVVTSNKELVAKHGRELLAIAKGMNVNYLFEASVGGGIPLIRPLTQCLAGNKIEEIYGILNGTTNYILTDMIENGASFEAALREAQRLGYAEANPSADIDGIDAGRKICILADICFGKEVRSDMVPTEGITGVTLEDVEAAEKLGYKIKLLGRAMSLDGKTCAFVAPHLVPKGNMLARVDGVMNGVVVRGNAVGETMFYGPGAGKLPTASAVVGDIIDALRHRQKRRDIGWEAGESDDFFDPSLLKTPWYVRAEGETASITQPCTREELNEALAGKTVLTAFRVLD